MWCCRRWPSPRRARSIRAAEGILDEDARNVDLVRKALDEGSVARLDLLSAESQLAQDQTLMPPLRQELSVARHALAVLVGQPPGNWSAPDFELEDFAPPSDLPVTCPPSSRAAARTFARTKRSSMRRPPLSASPPRISIRRSSSPAR